MSNVGTNSGKGRGATVYSVYTFTMSHVCVCADRHVRGSGGLVIALDLPYITIGICWYKIREVETRVAVWLCNQTRRVGESMQALRAAYDTPKSPWWCSITQGLDGGMR